MGAGILAKKTSLFSFVKNISQGTNSVGIANPASVFCEKNWGTLEILEWTWGQYGMCHLSDGNVCEEWAYMRGECKVIKQPVACTLEYAPVCALVHIQCVTTPCEPIEQTFWNACQMKANSLAEFLHDGECKTWFNQSDCPLRSQPAPWYCSGGVILDGGKDANWCQQHPTCQMNK